MTKPLSRLGIVMGQSPMHIGPAATTVALYARRLASVGNFQAVQSESQGNSALLSCLDRDTKLHL